MAAKTTTEEPKAATLTVDDLGRNIDLEKAKRLFGADKAYKALDVIAEAGGYGEFKPADYENPYFGGFAIPAEDNPNPIAARLRSKINTALKNLQ